MVMKEIGIIQASAFYLLRFSIGKIPLLRISTLEALLTSFTNPAVLLSSGCYNKLLQTGWLKKQTFISHCLGWEVPDQDAD